MDVRYQDLIVEFHVHDNNHACAKKTIPLLSSLDCFLSYNQGARPCIIIFPGASYVPYEHCPPIFVCSVGFRCVRWSRSKRWGDATPTSHQQRRNTPQENPRDSRWRGVYSANGVQRQHPATEKSRDGVTIMYSTSPSWGLSGARLLPVESSCKQRGGVMVKASVASGGGDTSSSMR